MTRSILTSTLTAMTIAGAMALAVGQQAGVDPRPPNAPNQTPAFPGQTRAPEKRLDVAFDVVTVVEGLQNPWSVAFLPGGKMLVTERPGRLRVLTADGKLSEPVAGLPPVDARGQGGLLDVALDPAFAKNQTGVLELCGAARGRRQQHGRGQGHVRGRRRAAGGRRQGDLSPGPVAQLAAALREPAGVRPGWHAVRDPGRALDHRGPHAGPAHGRPARQDRAAQPRRVDPEGQPLRRQGRRAARDLVARPPQRPVRRAPSRRPASCGRSSTGRAAATRSTSRARGRITAGRPSPTASSIAADPSPGTSRPSRAWSSRSTTGTP